MTLNDKATELCKTFGLDKATEIENNFLKLYSEKYFVMLMAGYMTQEAYTHGLEARLEKYIGLYLVHNGNII